MKLSISSFRYWNRPLNPRRLMELGHLCQKRNMSLQRTVRFHRLPEVRVGCHLQAQSCHYSLTFAWHVGHWSGETVTYTTVSSFVFFKVPKTLGLRPAAKGDLAEIHTLLQAELRKFQLSKILSLQEVEHWLLPRENVVDTYVVEVNFYLKQHALSYF